MEPPTGDREGLDPCGIEQAGRVSIRVSGAHEGARSTTWSVRKGVDPRLRRLRRVSIQGIERAGRVSIRCPRRPRRVSIRDPERAGGVSIRASGDCEGCRSVAWSRRKGCRSVPPATAQVFDPRHGAGRKCSIRTPRHRASVRSTRPARRGTVRSAARSELEVFDPRVRRSRKCSIRAFRCRASVRSTGSSNCSIRRFARAGRASPRNPLPRKCSIRSVRSVPEGVRSVGPALRRCSIRVAWSGLQVFDPCVSLPRKCSIRSFGKCSIRDIEPAGRVSDPRLRRLRRVSIRRRPVAGSVRSAPPAAAQVFDPRNGAGRICSIGAVSSEHPAGRGVRSGVGDRATVRSTRPARRATVRSAAWRRPDRFDPRPRWPRNCSIQGPAERAGVRSARIANGWKCSIGNQPAARFTPRLTGSLW